MSIKTSKGLCQAKHVSIPRRKETASESKGEGNKH